MPHVIEVTHLVKKYKSAEKNAVDDISFHVEAGTFFSLLGPNGAGKTTTISILTTTLTKTSGKIEITGYDLDRDPEKVRRNIGVIFQQPSLDLNLTAEENVRFHSVLYGLYPFRPFFSMMPAEYKKKVTELAEILGVKNELFRPLKTFSGGMKRKLEIIRSLIHDPKVLFLDEPTSGLDPVSRKNLWEYLTEIRQKQKTTMFLTTHYLEEAEDADEICIIKEGKIVFIGKPARIKNHLVDEYLLVESHEPRSLTNELIHKKISYEELPNKTTFKVALGKHTPHELIRSIATPLSMLKVHTPTLEEAYVELVENDHKPPHHERS
jgi:ABC-2 type transport system ATP-binding protein